MSDCLDNEVFERIVCDIKVLNYKLSNWLKSDDLILDNIDIVFKNQLKFKNFELNDYEFLDNDDIKKLKDYDVSFSKDLMSYEFEKDILIKKKSLALSRFDFTNVIKLTKGINTIIKKIDDIKVEIDKVVNNYTNKNNDYLVEYNQFVKDITSDKNIDQISKNVKYDKRVVSIYRINKICEYIVAEFNKKEFDLDCLFELDVIKELLGSDYLKVKRKVGILCGSK